MPERDLSTSEEVRSLSPAEIRKLSKDQLAFALRTLINELASETEAGPQAVQIAKIENKMDNMFAKWDRDREAMQTEIRNLRRDNEKMAEAVAHHQKMLEIMESDKRAGNLIVTGLPEDNMEGATTDGDKIKKVMSVMQLEDVEVKSVERLGARRPAGDTAATGRPHQRPVKVVLANNSDRQRVLDNTKKLKEAGNAMHRVYVKKDVHPLVRKELGRLREVEKRERDKPENQGRNVRYDYKERKVYVDSVVVDSYQGGFF